MVLTLKKTYSSCGKRTVMGTSDANLGDAGVTRNTGLRETR